MARCVSLSGMNYVGKLFRRVKEARDGVPSQVPGAALARGAMFVEVITCS